MLRIYDTVLEVLRRMRPVLADIGRHDPDLERQMRKALTSVPLNAGEGSYARGRNRPAQHQVALASMCEVRAGLDAAMALGYVDEVDPVLVDKVNHVIATFVRLVRPEWAR